jgi:hypothetical protein
MLFTTVMEQDNRLNSMPAIYVFLIMSIAGDGIVRSKDLEWNQIIAFVLIVAPYFLLISFRWLGIVKD